MMYSNKTLERQDYKKKRKSRTDRYPIHFSVHFSVLIKALKKKITLDPVTRLALDKHSSSLTSLSFQCMRCTRFGNDLQEQLMALLLLRYQSDVYKSIVSQSR